MHRIQRDDRRRRPPSPLDHSCCGPGQRSPATSASTVEEPARRLLGATPGGAPGTHGRVCRRPRSRRTISHRRCQATARCDDLSVHGQGRANHSQVLAPCAPRTGRPSAAHDPASVHAASATQAPRRGRSAACARATSATRRPRPTRGRTKSRRRGARTKTRGCRTGVRDLATGGRWVRQAARARRARRWMPSQCRTRSRHRADGVALSLHANTRGRVGGEGGAWYDERVHEHALVSARLNTRGSPCRLPHFVCANSTRQQLPMLQTRAHQTAAPPAPSSAPPRTGRDTRSDRRHDRRSGDQPCGTEDLRHGCAAARAPGTNRAIRAPDRSPRSTCPDRNDAST